MKRITIILLVSFISLSAFGENPSFTTGPKAEKEDNNIKISFEVSEKTDVEVSILDSDNKVVRHLAAGLLGSDNAPPSPLKPGLKQEIIWDGKNDTGSKVKDKNIKVRVRLGLSAKLDGFLEEEKEYIYQLAGLATDPKGNLYVYSTIVADHRGHSRCMQVFDRDGNYVRTIMPMPVNVPKKELEPFSATFRRGKTLTLNTPGEHFYPRNFFGTWPELYPGGMGRLVPWVREDGIVRIWNNRSIGYLTAEGACIGDRLWRGTVPKANWPWRNTRGAQCVVPSYDGKRVYLCGLTCYDSKKKAFSDTWPRGRVYRTTGGSMGAFEKWFDIPDGDEPAYAGAATLDPKGNFLVCNSTTRKLLVYDQAAKKLGEFEASTELTGTSVAPKRIFCHRKTGEIYAEFMKKKPKHSYAHYRRIIKYAPWDKGMKKIFEYDLPMSYTRYGLSGDPSHIALDDSADPAVLWVGTVAKPTKKTYLLRLEDTGTTFKKTLDLIDRSRGKLAIKSRMAVHPENDFLVVNDGYTGVAALNGITGEKIKLPFKGGVDMSVGLDGNWYIQIGNNYSGPLCRYDKNFKPLPIPGRTAGKKKPPVNALGSVYGRMGAGYCCIGLAADQKGRVFSLQFYTWAAYAVAIFGPDGVPENPGRLKDNKKMQACPRFKSAVVGPIDLTPGGLQVDFQGNIYLGLKALPTTHKPPKGWENARSGYSAMTGSIVKFGPKGGAAYALAKGKGAPEGKKGVVVDKRWGFVSPVNYKGFVEEPLKIYPGLSNVGGGFGDGCMCRQSMFQVDGWGRIWYPQATLSCIRVIDNNDNLIGQYGHYGNIDSRGASEDSLIKKPDIPIGWPQSVGVSNSYIYIADVLNRRIVRLKKEYAADQTVAIK